MKEKNNNPAEKSRRYRVGDFIFDARLGKLRNCEQEIRLEPQVAELFTLLVRNAGAVVARETIGATIWTNRNVSDDAIRAAVRKLRDALGDNARDPTYIKTQPLRGYTLIAPVSELKTPSPRHPWRRAGIAAGVLVTISALLYGLSSGVLDDRNGPTVSLEPLTALPGSELSPDYNPATRRLLFSHRSNKDDPLQLHVKYLDTQRVERLTWDKANYANAHWSPDGTELVYTRSTSDAQQHFIARFDPESGIRQPRALPQGLVGNKYLLGWAGSVRAIYLKDTYQPETPQAIWRFHLDSHTLEQVSSPNVPGIGDYFAAESSDGQLLAILRAVAQNKRELLVLDIASGSLLHARVLPAPADRLAWNPHENSLVLSAFDGTLQNYSLVDDRFTRIASPSSYINDVFFQCGTSCYYLRRHNGNFLDLQEEPDPFSHRALMSSEHFDLPGAEDFPVYGPGGRSLYFVSQRDGERLLQRHSQAAGTRTLARLPDGIPIASLGVNATGTHLAGLLGKRLFLFEIANQALEFINSDLEICGYPTWTQAGDSILYARYQKGRPTVYRYDIETGRQTVVADGFVAARELSDTRLLALDRRLQVWLIENGIPVKIMAVVPSEVPNRWQVAGDQLYYSEHRGNDAYMVRINIETGSREERLLAKNRFRLNFDISPVTGKMVGAKSLLAESDLIRLSLD